MMKKTIELKASDKKFRLLTNNSEISEADSVIITESKQVLQKKKPRWLDSKLIEEQNILNEQRLQH
jgi:hypothetical protein